MESDLARLEISSIVLGKLLQSFCRSYLSVLTISSISVPFLTSHMALASMTDAHWAALSPFLTYWIVSGFYEFLDTFNLFSQYRIRPSDEECKRNLAKKSAVLKYVLLMLAVHTAAGLVLAEMLPPSPRHDGRFGTLSYFHSISTDLWTSWKLDQDTLGFVATFLLAGSWLMRICYLVARQLLALVILDTWVFWGHYLEHQNTWLYRKLLRSGVSGTLDMY